MLSRRTFNSIDSVVTFVNDPEQHLVIREFIRTSYNFSKLVIRLLILHYIFSCCLAGDLLTVCYKIALDFYRKFSARIWFKFQSSSTLRAKNIDYFPQLEMENANPTDPNCSNEEDLPHEQSHSSTNNLEPELACFDLDGNQRDLWFDDNYDGKWWRNNSDAALVLGDADSEKATAKRARDRAVRAELEHLQSLDL